MESERFKMVVAVHLFLVDNEKILLLRRFNTGYEDGNYSVIAGHIDGNESIKSAMIREAKEEAGINILENDLKIIGVMHRKSSHESIDFFLKAEKWLGKIVNMEPNKCDELLWANKNNLPQNIIPYISNALSTFDNNWFSSFGI